MYINILITIRQMCNIEGTPLPRNKILTVGPLGPVSPKSPVAPVSPYVHTIA